MTNQIRTGNGTDENGTESAAKSDPTETTENGDEAAKPELKNETLNLLNGASIPSVSAALASQAAGNTATNVTTNGTPRTPMNTTFDASEYGSAIKSFALDRFAGTFS